MTQEEKDNFMFELDSYINETCEDVSDTLESNILNRINNFPQFYGSIPDSFKNACVRSAIEAYLASTQVMRDAIKQALERT
ncbi:hypothetical protein IMSAGC011_02201 [Lachnospiraceae bacterium]|nr:hypothetical protein IMSAGC011_02201 [Lachnospiraceae bacterium]